MKAADLKRLNEHYLLSKKMDAAYAGYRMLLNEAFELDIPMEFSKSGSDWEPVTECFFFPKEESYRLTL
jgi:hypothetical protein